MAQRFGHNFANARQPGHHPYAMAPPSVPFAPVDGTYNARYHAEGFPQNIPSFVDMYEANNDQAWRPISYQPLQNSIPTGDINARAVSSQRESRNQCLPAPTRDTPGRTIAISPTAWLKFKPIIKRLWLEENKSLEETKVILEEKHNFIASVDQYKKQIKKWKWSKYVKVEDALWMQRKAGERKEKSKDTEFRYHGRKLTTKDIAQRIGRKNVEPNVLASSAEAQTPCDISYTTPSNLLPSPCSASSDLTNSSRSKWEPPSAPISASQCYRLTWQDLNHGDYETRYQAGCRDEQSGRALDAETNFRAVLDGFHNLLSTTHPRTVKVARHLASFYAGHDRMREAELIFDWLTKAHVEEFGRFDTRSRDHLLNVVKFLQNHDRFEEAATFLGRTFATHDELEVGIERANEVENMNAAQSSASRYARHSLIPGGSLRDDILHSANNTLEPAWLYNQLHRMETTQGGSESTDEVWDRLLKYCEELPQQLMPHSLTVHAAFIKHLAQNDDTMRLDGAINQAEKTIRYVLHSDQSKTVDLYESCIRVTKEFVRAQRYESAEGLFKTVEASAQDSFGFAHTRTIKILKSIGVFYQNEGRWEDAAPRFEQALAASYSRYCMGNEEVQRLEAAYEDQHYSSGAQVDEDHFYCV